MYILYNELGWALRAKLDADDFYVGAAADGQPFPGYAFPDLDTLIAPADDDCKIWLGGAQYRSRPNCIPYYFNKYIPEYPRHISARQLLIARYLNIHFLTMPRFRVGMTCTTPACVEISHLIPYAYYPRTKKGQIAPHITVVAPEAPQMSEEQKQSIQDRVMKAIQSSSAPSDITSLLPKSGRTSKDFTPEELTEIERSRQPKTAEPEDTTIDDVLPGRTTKQ
jgi:hypothetical protein